MDAYKYDSAKSSLEHMLSPIIQFCLVDCCVICMIAVNFIYNRYNKISYLSEGNYWSKFPNTILYFIMNCVFQCEAYEFVSFNCVGVAFVLFRKLFIRLAWNVLTTLMSSMLTQHVCGVCNLVVLPDMESSMYENVV